MIEIICITDCIFQVCHSLVMGLISTREGCEVLLLHTKLKVQLCVPEPALLHVAELLQCLVLPLTSVS